MHAQGLDGLADRPHDFGHLPEEEERRDDEDLSLLDRLHHVGAVILFVNERRNDLVDVDARSAEVCSAIIAIEEVGVQLLSLAALEGVREHPGAVRVGQILVALHHDVPVDDEELFEAVFALEKLQWVEHVEGHRRVDKIISWGSLLDVLELGWVNLTEE